VRRQCELLGLNRSTWYYEPAPESATNLALMRLIDEQYLRTPFYGRRRMTEDKAFDQAMLLHMVKRIGARITTVPVSHAVFMTQAKAVADTIEQAAQGALAEVQNLANDLSRPGIGRPMRGARPVG